MNTQELNFKIVYLIYTFEILEQSAEINLFANIYTRANILGY